MIGRRIGCCKDRNLMCSTPWYPEYFPQMTMPVMQEMPQMRPAETMRPEPAPTQPYRGGRG